MGSSSIFGRSLNDFSGLSDAACPTAIEIEEDPRQMTKARVSCSVTVALRGATGSHQGRAAVDAQDLAGDVASLFGQQKAHCGANVPAGALAL
jgi:hypothetical protein